MLPVCMSVCMIYPLCIPAHMPVHAVWAVQDVFPDVGSGVHVGNSRLRLGPPVVLFPVRIPGRICRCISTSRGVWEVRSASRNAYASTPHLVPLGHIGVSRCVRNVQVLPACILRVLG